MTESVCQTCGGPLPPEKAPGRPRQYCTERCRKDQYRGRCIDCGKPTDGSNGAAHAPLRCTGCANRHVVASGTRADMVGARANRERIQAMWASGFLMKEIAAEFGWTIHHLSAEFGRMRNGGWDLPHRYRMRNGRRVAA